MKIHTCPTCGYEWEHGKHGEHNCSTLLLKKIESLEALSTESIKALSLNDDDIVLVDIDRGRLTPELYEKKARKVISILKHLGVKNKIIVCNEMNITAIPEDQMNRMGWFRINNDTIPLPKTLTADNGAKGLLIGEFHEEYRVPCPAECQEFEGCEACGDSGYVNEKVTVSWTTIKEIYKKIVEHFA